jgi:hypothetical protein
LFSVNFFASTSAKRNKVICKDVKITVKQLILSGIMPRKTGASGGFFTGLSHSYRFSVDVGGKSCFGINNVWPSLMGPISVNFSVLCPLRWLF